MVHTRNIGTLECQFIGPTLKFQRATVIALTGAEMQAKLDGKLLPLWESIAVAAGQTLAFGSARIGARGYLAIAGGICNEAFFGSRATFHKGGLGGMEGHAIKAGQVIPVGEGNGTAGRKVRVAARPPIVTDKRWQVEVVRGPNDDWIDEAGHTRFLSTDWKLSSKSDRGGFRLEGPEWSFTARATNKLPEHGSDPANIVDHGYPVGAINLAGQYNSNNGGLWEVRNGQLWGSYGNAPLQLVQPFSVTRNSNGSPIINSLGKEYSSCR